MVLTEPYVKALLVRAFEEEGLMGIDLGTMEVQTMRDWNYDATIVRVYNRVTNLAFEIRISREAIEDSNSVNDYFAQAFLSRAREFANKYAKALAVKASQNMKFRPEQIMVVPPGMLFSGEAYLPLVADKVRPIKTKEPVKPVIQKTRPDGTAIRKVRMG